MKRIVSCLTLATTFLLLTACGNQSTNNGQTTETTSTSSAHDQSVFTGTVEEVIESDEEDQIIRVKLVDVKAKIDPENIGTSFANDGVILNAPADKIKPSVDALSEGTEVELTLAKTPVMTMSLPPQIPGNSIIQVLAIQ
ncbi:hypothetical protein [Candidatus Enterococcus courvalinii]|uniref:Lipoprotein n=1 Tax=Candidatus Enterococcus courvalinii TaxID=2815329 RepID=A0ABS3HWV6_9ENTE|nr:hypothetical protein [Enterococcus sp. MSG2901]MBO0480953.1 hypothetical protein [Enterococcus sp. MSG2901]